MANHRSALKRHRQSLLRRHRNRTTKAQLQTLVRRVREAVDAGDAEAAGTHLHTASRALAKAASKNVLHRRTAARRAGRLAAQVAKLSASS